MIGRRRIWLTALILCIAGALGCIGCGIWLHGVAWRMGEDDQQPPATTQEARRANAEQRVILIGQITVMMGA